MNLDQVITLCGRIRQHRPTFKDGTELWNEWLTFLKKYDNKEVNDSLDMYLRYDTDKRIPSVIELIKDLMPLEEYRSSNEYKTNCRICGRVLYSSELDKHFDKCSSIDYLYRMSKKYFNKEIEKSSLWKMEDSQFNRIYWNFCEKLVDNPEILEMEKKSLTNAILTHYEREPKHNINEVMGA